MKWLIKHTDTHLRIRTLIAEAGRELRAATRDDRGNGRFYGFSHFGFWGNPLVGVARSYECSRQDNHLSRGIVQQSIVGLGVH
jgi:hypothetical protein